MPGTWSPGAPGPALGLAKTASRNLARFWFTFGRRFGTKLRPKMFKKSHFSENAQKCMKLLIFAPRAGQKLDGEGPGPAKLCIFVFQRAFKTIQKSGIIFA